MDYTQPLHTYSLPPEVVLCATLSSFYADIFLTFSVFFPLLLPPVSLAFGDNAEAGDAGNPFGGDDTPAPADNANRKLLEDRVVQCNIRFCTLRLRNAAIVHSALVLWTTHPASTVHYSNALLFFVQCSNVLFFFFFSLILIQLSEMMRPQLSMQATRLAEMIRQHLRMKQIVSAASRSKKKMKMEFCRAVYLNGSLSS